VEHGHSHLEHLDPTAALWLYRLDGDRLVVEGRRASAGRNGWREADRKKTLYLRLADLSGMDRSNVAVLRSDWRDRALAFANLYAPPVPTRRLALARAIPLRWFAEEALIVRWSLHLWSSLHPGKRKSRTEAAKAAIQIRSLVPSLSEDTFLTHCPRSRGDDRIGVVDEYGGASSSSARGQVAAASSSTDEVERRLKDLSSRHGQHALWSVTTNVFASLLNIRLEGVTPVCLPGATRSGLPRLGFGFRFPSPLARIWFGLWEDTVGIKTAECERCGRAFPVARVSQRFCSRNCQTAAGVERHRNRKRRVKA
jgi:hypothetical protein